MGADDDDDDDDDGWDPENQEPLAVEVGDVLDLHTFAPRDVAALVRDYLDECAARGFTRLRIIHGKGQGNLRRITHSVLDKHPKVSRYTLAPPDAGGWGATLVELDVEPPPG